jgi:selenocysteine lyase/cysteine desulfurase
LESVHFDNAGAGLMPAPVLGAVVDHLNREARVGGYQSAENATVAYFQALAAFDFHAGDVIVTTRNDYISNQLAFLSLTARYGVDVRRAADLPSGGVDPDSVEQLLREPRVRLLSATWVPTNSGLIQPVERLGELAERAGVPYLVDACQAVGQLPIDVSRLRCDYLSATARKFLRGPRGIGFLYVSDRALSRGDAPLLVDMRGAAWVAADSYRLEDDARRFENWEFAYSLVLGLGEAARYALDVGVEAGGGRARTLAEALRRACARLPGARVLDRGAELGAIVTVAFADTDAADLVRALRHQHINASASRREYAVIDMAEKQAATAVRLSPHYYNTEEEIEAVVSALARARAIA